MAIDAGDAAPDFAVQDDTGATVRLEDFRGKGLVVYFYPRAFTPGCTTQACDIRDSHEAFTEADYAVVGVSPDTVDTLAQFRDEHGLPFPLLSDPDHTMARAFGAYGTKKNYGREYEGIIRSTFVIDPEGVVVEAWRNVRAKGHADRLLRVMAGDT